MVYRIGNNYCSPYLQHFGILGMKWGVRRYQNEDGSLTEAGKARYNKQMSKAAKKDAKRYLNAKQYYGEGAGTRRKLLKGELSKKMKDPTYKKYFDEYVANGDIVKATNRAKAERHARDAAAQTKRIVRTLAPIAVLAAGVYYASHKDQVDKVILRTTEKVVSSVKNVGKKTKKPNYGDWSAVEEAQRIFEKNAKNMNNWRNMHR